MPEVGAWSACTCGERFRHVAHDTQGYMHVDTFMPTWKVWLFGPTPLSAGPLMYVKGSHRWGLLHAVTNFSGGDHSERMFADALPGE